jgi:hypothetical protein
MPLALLFMAFGEQAVPVRSSVVVCLDGEVVVAQAWGLLTAMVRRAGHEVVDAEGLQLAAITLLLVLENMCDFVKQGVQQESWTVLEDVVGNDNAGFVPQVGDSRTQRMFHGPLRGKLAVDPSANAQCGGSMCCELADQCLLCIDR